MFPARGRGLKTPAPVSVTRLSTRAAEARATSPRVRAAQVPKQARDPILLGACPLACVLLCSLPLCGSLSLHWDSLKDKADPSLSPRKMPGRWREVCFIGNLKPLLPAVVALGAVPVVLGTMGFTGAGIAASSLAAKMMSAATIANGGGVAAGSLVAALQSVGECPEQEGEEGRMGPGQDSVQRLSLRGGPTLSLQFCGPLCPWSFVFPLCSLFWLGVGGWVWGTAWQVCIPSQPYKTWAGPHLSRGPSLVLWKGKCLPFLRGSALCYWWTHHQGSRVLSGQPLSNAGVLGF